MRCSPSSDALAGPASAHAAPKEPAAVPISIAGLRERSPQQEQRSCTQQLAAAMTGAAGTSGAASDVCQHAAVGARSAASLAQAPAAPSTQPPVAPDVQPRGLGACRRPSWGELQAYQRYCTDVAMAQPDDLVRWQFCRVLDLVAASFH